MSNKERIDKVKGKMFDALKILSDMPGNSPVKMEMRRRIEDGDLDLDLNVMYHANKDEN